MYRRILVPVEQSGSGDRALVHAIELAASVGAELRLLHIVEEEMTSMFEVTGVDIAATEAAEADSADAYLGEAADRARKAGVSAENIVLPSEGANAADAILAHAQEWGADLIVMGAHPRSGVRKALFGSTADDIVQNSPVPVLQVRL